MMRSLQGIWPPIFSTNVNQCTFLNLPIDVCDLVSNTHMTMQRLEKDKHATQRDRWRARMKPNNSLTFAHALLFSAAAAMIGKLFAVASSAR
jgi:hypothetical protein